MISPIYSELAQMRQYEMRQAAAHHRLVSGITRDGSPASNRLPRRDFLFLRMRAWQVLRTCATRLDLRSLTTIDR